jgi:hypothetical protein
VLAPWVVAATNGTGTAGADFTTYDTVNNSVQRFAAYQTYGALGLNDPTLTASDVANPGSPTVLTTSPTVFGLKLSNAVTDPVGGHTLTIGAAGSPSGLILNGGSIAASSLVFAGTEAVIYTTAQNGTISSPITAGGLTTFGPGKLTLSGANSVAAVAVNAGTLNLTGTTNASGAVAVNNGGTLTGTGTIITTGTNGVAFGPKGTFAPGNGTSFGIFNITTATGNVTTTAPTTVTAPTTAGGTPPLTIPNLTSAGLGFGLGISPTNVVGSAFTLNLGVPLAIGSFNTGASNASILGSRAGGFNFTSSGGSFILDPITTVTVIANPANFAPLSSYSYLVGTVPATSSGSVTNLGNFEFTNGVTSFDNIVTNASFTVSGGSVYMNFTTVPEPALLGLLAATGIVGFRRKLLSRTTAA